MQNQRKKNMTTTAERPDITECDKCHAVLRIIRKYKRFDTYPINTKTYDSADEDLFEKDCTYTNTTGDIFEVCFDCGMVCHCDIFHDAHKHSYCKTCAPYAGINSYSEKDPCVRCGIAGDYICSYYRGLWLCDDCTADT